jgi:hypothetical protein
MAYSLRLSGIGKEKGKELFCIEPTWWKISELAKLVKIHWVTTNETGSYSDDDADISADEFRILHEHFKSVLVELIAFNVGCLESYKKYTDEHAAARVEGYTKYVSQLQGELQTLESALGEDADKFAHFHLCVFEWDSGY